MQGASSMKCDLNDIVEVASALRRKAEKLIDKSDISDPSQVEPDTLRLLHELQVRHIELEMQNAELCLARDAAESDKAKIEVLLTQSKVADLILVENKRLLEELRETLERRICEGILELRKRDNMLLSQNRQAAMGEMINNIAHQWRQPLNTMGLIIQELPLAYEMGDLDKEFLSATVKESMGLIEQMSQTINDFRNFFSPDKELVSFEVNNAINAAVSLVKECLKIHNIKLDIISQGNLLIKGYPNEFSQALLNVIINAKDALVEHNIKQPHITVTSFIEKEKSVVVIADNAGGIPEQYIGRVFEPYFTTKGPAQGTGIGLYMAKTIIENNMNGRLSVSNKNGGAEFRIEV